MAMLEAPFDPDSLPTSCLDVAQYTASSGTTAMARLVRIDPTGRIDATLEATCSGRDPLTNWTSFSHEMWYDDAPGGGGLLTIQV